MSINKSHNRVVVILFAFLLVFSFAISSAYGDTQYVSDQLIITLRAGKGDEFKILKTLKTGTPVEVLEEGGENIYYRVRIEDGTEGWVRKRYITPEIPKATVIARQRKEIARLKTAADETKTNRDALQDELKAAQWNNAKRVKELEKNIKLTKNEANHSAADAKKMAEKYDTLVAQSKDVVTVISERDELKATNERLSSENAELKQENERLMLKEMIWWFVAGGGVFFIGWISGKVSRKKKRLY